MAGAAKDPALLGSKREDVAGSAEVDRGHGRIGDRPRGGGAVVRARPGRDDRSVVDRHGERRLVTAVGAHHLGDLELVQPPGRHRQAHDAPPVRDHEVERLRGAFLRRDDEVAFVLAIGVVDDQHDPSLGDVGDRNFDGREDRPVRG